MRIFFNTIKKIPAIIQALLLYSFLMYLLINNYYVYLHTLWILPIIKHLLPGFIAGLFILKNKKSLLIFPIIAPIADKLFIFIIAFNIFFLPPYMEIMMYLYMAGTTFAGSLLGFIIKRLYQKFFPNNNQTPIA
jgi:hypothetical protein